MGGDGGEEGEDPWGDISGSVGDLPDGNGMLEDIKQSMGEIKDAVAGEVGSWKVWQIQAFNPGVATWSFTWNLGPVGSYQHAFDPGFLATIRMAVLVSLSFCFLAGAMRILSWR